jgi:hypothetical protein
MNPSNNPEQPNTEYGPARLPDFTRSVWFLALMWPLAQALLLFLHFRSFTLIRGEMTEPQIQVALWIGLGCLVHVLTATACVLLPSLRTALLRPWGLAVWILSQIVVLWAFVAFADKALPIGLAPWLFEPIQVYGVQFMLTMPGLFLALLFLATIPLPLSPGRDVGLSAATLILPPLLVYLSVHFLSALHRFFTGRTDAWISYGLLVAAVLGTALLFWGLFRLLMWAYRWLLARGPWAERALVVLVALVLPVGGLLLNRKFPFPFDFQYTFVYLLTVLNTAALLWPSGTTVTRRWTAWLFQCLTFSFTLYFFLVFIPFFPLAIPAIIAAGAGFLILAPAALFFIHVARLRQSFSALGGAAGPRHWAALVGLAAFLILPGSYLAGCWMDRQALAAAMEHVYHPDSRNVTRFTGTTRALQSLELLRDRKAGHWIPILTPIYHQIAFNGLVLPDAKMQHLYRVLSGKELELQPKSGRDLARNLGFGGSWRDRQRGWAPTNLPRGTIWEKLEQSTGDHATQMRTSWKFQIRNPGPRQDEFACQMQLTPGTFVTGLRLKIGQDWAEGKLFEKKAALWIYEMIKSARQDPALVVYSGRQEISLRVFPLEAGQTREVEVTFLHPKGISPILETIPKGPPGMSPFQTASGRLGPLTASNPTHQVLWMPEMPPDAARTRRPHLVVLEDVSTPGRLSGVERARVYSSLLATKPDSPISAWTFHHEVLLGVSDWKMSLPLPESMELPAPNQKQTGRNMLAVVCRSLEWSRTSGNPQEEFPALILASKIPPSAEEIRQVAGMVEDAVPDFPWLGHLDPTGKLRWLDGSGQDVSEATPRQVFLASSQNRVFAQPAGAGPVMWTAPGTDPIRPLHAVLPPVTTLSPEDPWSKAALLHAWSQETALNPWLAHLDWQNLVVASKAASTLVPETAWIVLERAAHWEKLKRMENQKLGGDKELGVMETPEPSTVALAIALVMALWAMRRWRTRRLIPEPID